MKFLFSGIKYSAGNGGNGVLPSHSPIPVFDGNDDAKQISKKKNDSGVEVGMKNRAFRVKRPETSGRTPASVFNDVNGSILLNSIDPKMLSDLIAERVAELIVPRLESSQSQRLIGADEMAEIAGISRATIDRLVSSNSIPSLLIGRARRFDPNDVLEALKSYRAK